jgi:hypothetical protein
MAELGTPPTRSERPLPGNNGTRRGGACRQARAAFQNAARCSRARHVLGFRLAHAGIELRQIPLVADRRHALARLGRGGEGLPATPTSVAAGCGKRYQSAGPGALNAGDSSDTGRKICAGRRGMNALTPRRLFRDGDGNVIVEHWLVHGAAHAWFGGEPRESYAHTQGPMRQDI